MTAWATSSWPLPSPTSGTSRAFRPAWATCWTWRPRTSSGSSTSLRTSSRASTIDRRHKDLPEIESESRGREAGDRDRLRDDDVKKRLNELEDRLKELEGEGAKGAQLSAAKREAQRDVERITEQAKRETDHLDDVARRVQGPERQAAGGRRRRLPLAARAVRRLLRRRHGRRGDQAPALGLRRRGRGRVPPRPDRERQGHASPEGDQAPEGRVELRRRASPTPWAWCSTPSR